MIPDEIDGVGPAKSRPISGWIYESLCGAALVVMTVIVVASLRVIRSHLGDLGGTLSYVWPACIVPIVGWSRAFVDAGLRRCGLGKAAKTIELWTQVGRPPDESTPIDEVVTVRADRDFQLLVSVFCFAACVPSFAWAATLLVNLVASPPSPDDRWIRIGSLLIASMSPPAPAWRGLAWSAGGTAGHATAPMTAGSSAPAGSRSSPGRPWRLIASPPTSSPQVGCAAAPTS